MFYQLEGLAVDEGITMADLKGTLTEFARQLFGAETKVRFRCDFFPFVEPGVDFAVDLPGLRRQGLPRLQADRLDRAGRRGHGPSARAAKWSATTRSSYTGFAFGMGSERIVMLKYGIDDIRDFYANDLRFLRSSRDDGYDVAVTGRRFERSK